MKSALARSFGCNKQPPQDADCKGAQPSTLEDAREVGHAIAVMYALHFTSYALIHCGDYATANARLAELVPLAEEKNAAQWRAGGIMHQGWVCALTGKAADAVHTITSGITAWQSAGSIVFVPWYLASLAGAYAKLSQFADSRRCIGEARAAIELTKERWCEAEVHRMAGEISLKWPHEDEGQPETHFKRALASARAQQTKSFELRAAMSLARLWRDQGKVQQTRELLAPVYRMSS